MLAPRILHFSKHQIFWDCTEMSACETLPAGLPLSLDQQSARDRHWRARLQESARGTKLLSGVNDDSLDDLWRSTVRDYTSLDLTNQTDKRMAIWGVVKRLREIQSEEYVAGMWEGALEEQLAWRVVDCTTSKRPSELNINPTWSWTSMQGTILNPSRSARWQRSYIIRDHAGDRIWFDIGEQGIRPRLPKKRSESASDMTRELDLLSERRRHSSTTTRTGSQPDVLGSLDAAQTPRPLLRSRTSSPLRMEHTPRIPSSRQGTQSFNAQQNSQTSPDERREIEPALKSNKIAMQGFLHVGRLSQNQPRSWSLEIPHAFDKTDEIDAFPDLVSSLDYLETIFVVLALTERSNKDETNTREEEVWFEGHGLLLQEANEPWCFRRTGALDIRHLSYKTWQCLRTTSSSLPGSIMETDTTPCKNFYIE
jgi:hypothetical protein